AAALVHFTPGARTAWHTHPHGQTIFVTEGVGLCQRDGGPIEAIRPGDRVFFEPGENHWHGAAPDRFMAHIVDAAERRLWQPRHLGGARHRRAVQRRQARLTTMGPSSPSRRGAEHGQVTAVVTRDVIPGRERAYE